MSMADLEQAMILVREHRELGYFGGPRDEHLVQVAEAALGLTFPPTYRRFLRELGAGSIAGEEFYGIIHEDFEHSSAPDAIWLTLTARRLFQLPRIFIIVNADGFGTKYCLDSSRVDHLGEYPVVPWEAGMSEENVNRLPIAASDFGAFFLAGTLDALEL